MTDTTRESDREYMHPGYKKMYPIRTVLRDLAGQEGCDGEPYDAMQFAADTIDALEKALAAAEAREKALLDMISASKEPSGIAVSESVFEMHRAALKKRPEGT